MTSSAVAVRQNNGMQRYSYDEIERMGAMIVDSGLAPKDVDAPKAVVLILMGQEKGLGPMESLTDQYVVNGRVGSWTKLMVAQYRKAGHTYVVKERSREQCVVEFWRKDATAPYTHTFKMAEAATAGYTNKPMWKSHPAVMLMWRCLSTGIRIVAPEVERARLDDNEIESLDAGEAASDADVWNDADAIGQRILLLQARLEELLDARSDTQSDETIDAVATEIEPHWSESFSDQETFKAKVAELTLTNGDALAALTKSAGKPIERVGEFPGTLADALDAMNSYINAQAGSEPPEKLF